MVSLFLRDDSVGGAPMTGGARTYSSPKVIHPVARRARRISSPQATVNNFGGGAKMTCEKLPISLHPRGWARRAPEDELCAPTHQRLWGDVRSAALRLVVKEYSEPFACKCKLRRRTSISASIRQGPRARPRN